MRYLAVTFPADDSDAGGIYSRLVPYASRRNAALYNLTLLDDGTTLELVRVEGDRAAIEAELDGRENLLAYELFRSTGETHHVYQHVDQDAELLALLEHLKAHRLLVDFPIRYGERGVTVRLVGESEMVHRAFDGLPPAVREELHVERLAEYDPELSGPRANLTPRQREVLETAVAVGYYADPRRATVADVAAALDVSQATVSEHLRKLEARVFAALA